MKWSKYSSPFSDPQPCIDSGTAPALITNLDDDESLDLCFPDIKSGSFLVEELSAQILSATSVRGIMFAPLTRTCASSFICVDTSKQPPLPKFTAASHNVSSSTVRFEPTTWSPTSAAACLQTATPRKRWV